MLRRLRSILMHMLLPSLVCAATVPAMDSAAAGFDGRAVVAVPAGHGHRVFRRDRFARSHFRGPAVIGIDDGAFGIASPQAQIQEEPSIELPSEGYDEIPSPDSSVQTGPQIITLPDPPRGGGGSKFEATPPVAGVPSSTGEKTSMSVTRRPRSAIYHHRTRAWRRRWPAYAHEFSAIVFAPCGPAWYTVIYNTPCGIPPFE
jgi:hypothetical protein